LLPSQLLLPLLPVGIALSFPDADDEAGDGELPHRPAYCRRTPLLRPHGSPGLPLRRAALAASLGVAHDCGVEGCPLHQCLGKDERSKGSCSGFTMRSVVSARCPLTKVTGLVAFRGY
jgi:hypothetical protein